MLASTFDYFDRKGSSDKWSDHPLEFEDRYDEILRERARKLLEVLGVPAEEE